MSENRFWNEMRNSIGHLGHFSRVESHETSAGIPDIDFCMDSIEGHIELKYGNDKNRPKIRPTQLKWFINRKKMGGRPIVFAKILLEGQVRYCFYNADKITDLFNAKSNQEWIDLADTVYLVAHWETFMYTIKTMCITKKTF
jgi:hypothetical protein